MGTNEAGGLALPITGGGFLHGVRWAVDDYIRQKRKRGNKMNIDKIREHYDIVGDMKKPKAGKKTTKVDDVEIDDETCEVIE
jgi:hypothetical protein